MQILGVTVDLIVNTTDAKGTVIGMQSMADAKGSIADIIAVILGITVAVVAHKIVVVDLDTK